MQNHKHLICVIPLFHNGEHVIVSCMFVDGKKIITVFQWHWNDCSFFFNRGSGLTLVSPHHTCFLIFLPSPCSTPFPFPRPPHNPSPSQLSVYNQQGTRGFMGWTLTVISPNAGLLCQLWCVVHICIEICSESSLCRKWAVLTCRPTYLPDGGNLNYELLLISDWDKLTLLTVWYRHLS